jgi:hypothetical protein
MLYVAMLLCWRSSLSQNLNLKEAVPVLARNVEVACGSIVGYAVKCFRLRVFI